MANEAETTQPQYEDPAEGLFAFGDEDGAIPETLIPRGTEANVRVVGVPSIKAGVGEPSAKYVEGYRYAMLKITLEAPDHSASPFIDGTIMFPSPDDSPRDTNRKAAHFGEAKKALGWTPPPGFVPLQNDGQEFPELAGAEACVVVGQKFNKGRGEIENIVQKWVVR